MPPKDERSLGELLSELSRETSLLVRKEVELATTEMTAKARAASANVAAIAAGGALAHAALLVLLAALVVGLSQLGIAPALAATIVAVVVAAVGYFLIHMGVSRLRSTRVVPTHTIETLKEDAKWTTRQGA
jgi:drug/metabolite transporter (DMT)-like permease